MTKYKIPDLNNSSQLLKMTTERCLKSMGVAFKCSQENFKYGVHFTVEIILESRPKEAHLIFTYSILLFGSRLNEATISGAGHRRAAVEGPENKIFKLIK